MGEVRRRSFTFCTTCEKPPKPACLEAGHVLAVGTYDRCEGEDDLGGRSTSSVDAEDAVCPGVNTKGHGWSDE
jgi:hypothetical protein